MTVENCSGKDAAFTWHLARALLPSGWASDVRVSVAAGEITSIVSDRAAKPGDVLLGTGVPAVGNLHSHSFQRAMAGLTEFAGAQSDSFWSWRQLMYRFVDAIDPDTFEAIAAFAFMEMMEAGYCRVGEFHYLHKDPSGEAYGDPAEMASRIASAAAQAGIALTLLPVFYAHGGFGGAAPSPAQRRFIHDIDGFAKLIDHCRSALAGIPHAILGIAPHSLRAVTPEELGALLPLVPDGPVHIHIAEQTREVDDCLAWSGARPVRWLLDNAPVDDRWCLVHATHVDAEEISAMARSGAVVGLCPITEANLGDGIFPAKAFVEAKGDYGVGTDSNVRIELAEELRLLEYGQRLNRRARNVMGEESRSTGRSLFDHCVKGGGKALGVESGLVVGASADLIVLDGEGPAGLGRSGDAVLDTFIFAAGQSAVREVWRAGEQIVTGGRHRARGVIEDRYIRALKGLLQT